MARFDAILFDLDGTLADTAEDIAASMNAALARFDLPKLATERVVGYVGAGVRRLVERCFADMDEASAMRGRGNFDPIYQAFMESYGAHLLDRTALYPGVRETLEKLAPRPMGVVTNKPEAMSRKILEGLGVAKFFASVVGGDTFPVRKPDPMPIRALLTRLAARPERTLLVGDSAVDIAAGAAAGVPVAVVSYGYGRGDDLTPAAFRLKEFSDILPLLEVPR